MSKPAPTPAPQHDPTPTLARQVIDVYADALADAHFPDIDLESLQREQQALQTSQLEFERAEAALAQARDARDAQAEQLRAKAERALAYARIFAQGQPELSARLADIGKRKASSHEPGDANPTPRKSKRKRERADELFAGEARDAEAPAQPL